MRLCQVVCDCGAESGWAATVTELDAWKRQHNCPETGQTEGNNPVKTRIATAAATIAVLALTGCGSSHRAYTPVVVHHHPARVTVTHVHVRHAVMSRHSRKHR